MCNAMETGRGENPSEIVRSITLECLNSKQCFMTLALSGITDKLELDGMCSQVGTFFFFFFFNGGKYL